MDGPVKEITRLSGAHNGILIRIAVCLQHPVVVRLVVQQVATPNHQLAGQLMTLNPCHQLAGQVTTLNPNRRLAGHHVEATENNCRLFRLELLPTGIPTNKF